MWVGAPVADVFLQGSKGFAGTSSDLVLGQEDPAGTKVIETRVIERSRVMDADEITVHTCRTARTLWLVVDPTEYQRLPPAWLRPVFWSGSTRTMAMPGSVPGCGPGGEMRCASCCR
jgi:hypothetical protein